MKHKAAAHVAIDLQCWFTVEHVKNKYFRFKGKKMIPSGGEVSVVPTRHQVTCSSKPGVQMIFFLFSFMLFVLRF